ncbi:GntR family transcriptional regulator [Saccharopolyspora sp. ASAGF58]|uniref:GntR family transcriptional regulator n=1 Tax=Saccharopolyspora sp. ASAGF58 TaxID=2719023 RepID=UPI001440228E|nr:GntR family transcriptional regulator [Saccharopolyspora sp. ASAGF58]QIZ37785.1 GntR family transcriptional regulator [Saccharopolyspora sp. ASAGF58]
MTAKFAPLELRTRPDGVYQVLRQAILDGTLPAGGQLREAHIAADMGISRSPVREALTKLEEDGLVTKVAFCGTFVAEVSAEAIAQIASIRYLVEPYAAALSAKALQGSRNADMRAAVTVMRLAADRDDIPASIDAHLQLHRLFYEHSGHELLQDMWDGWETKLRLFLAADHRSYSDLHEIATAHEDLMTLILSGDVDEFRHALAHHVHSAPGAPLQDHPAGPLAVQDSLKNRG